MIEYLDVLDEQGEKTGESLPYDEVHKKGLFHRGVHVWFINSKRELLLQKRTANKRAYPDHWTMSAGGHISAGETTIEAAQKETREEIGLDLPASEFILLYSMKQPRIVHREDYTDDEFDDVYLVHKDIDISDLTYAPDEVADARWIPVDEFKEWIKGNGELLTPHTEEYERLLTYM